jgi:hypothetical protein
MSAPTAERSSIAITRNCLFGGSARCSASLARRLSAAASGERRRPEPAAPDRRAVHALAVLDSRRMTAMLRAEGRTINRSVCSG